RTIDLDILLYGEKQIDNERLAVPHPRMHERAFVLIPLRDIANEVRIPTVERTVQELINDLSHEDLNDVIGWRNEGWLLKWVSSVYKGYKKVNNGVIIGVRRN